jgi:hypothetical protein
MTEPQQLFSLVDEILRGVELALDQIGNQTPQLRQIALTTAEAPWNGDHPRAPSRRRTRRRLPSPATIGPDADTERASNLGFGFAFRQHLVGTAKLGGNVGRRAALVRCGNFRANLGHGAPVRSRSAGWLPRRLARVSGSRRCAEIGMFIDSMLVAQGVIFMQLPRSREQFGGGDHGRLELVAADACERRMGMPGIKLQLPRREVAGWSSARLEEPHLIGAIPSNGDAPRSLAWGGGGKERHIGSDQPSFDLMQSFGRIVGHAGYETLIIRTVRRRS